MADVELEQLLRDLASPDPHVRDAGAYFTLATRLEQGSLDDSLDYIGDRCVAMLGDPEIQARTFAVLILGGVVERLAVSEAPSASPGGELVQAWLEPFMTWYAGESDLCGYHETLGWLHAVAHGADTLACFAESGQLNHDMLHALLDLVVTRAVTDTAHRWTDGEDDRLAYAALAVLRQAEFGPERLSEWVSRLAAGWTPVLARPAPASTDNAMHVARSLFIQLHLGPAAVDEHFRAGDGSGQAQPDEHAPDPPDRAVLLDLLSDAVIRGLG